MKASNQLFSLKNPYDINSDGLFLQAMQENCRFQYEHCDDYRRILQQQNFHPDMLKQYEDLEKLPFLPTLYFKHHSLFSMPERQLLIKATSSGTSGNKSRIGFDFSSLYRGLRMVITQSKYHKLLSMKPCHYLIFGYEPHKSNETAFSKTAFGFTFFAPALSRSYALRHTNNGYQLDLDGLKENFQKYEHSVFPVRTAGFPAYTYFLLRQMKEEGIRVKMPKGSVLTLGGGWKQFYAEKVAKKELYSLVEEILGIKEENVMEFFGAVEHPILYVDCRNHHFHVPVYSRVIIRDVDTLEPLSPGKLGLVNLLSPMCGSMPILSIMTDDLGILHEEPCSCGVQTPWLEIIGRVGIKDIVTCAAGGDALLKGGDGQ